MRNLLLVSATLSLALAACTDTTGLSAESSRGSHGNANSAIVIQEFADLQCPACRAAQAQIVLPIMEQYGKDVRLEFMHFPLRSIHRYALEAAEAAECAADQGKFWEYTDLVYTEQEKLNSEQLAVWAGQLGLDTELFDRCMKSHIKRDTILADYEEGRELGVGGTPTFFVQGKRVETGVATIGAAIEEALGAMQQRL